jgi:two-component system osmolarity sensor histidine kinase EnvZ
MHHLYRSIVFAIKRLLPTSLFGRALLIFVVPIALVQAVAIYVFYERHWESVTRNMSASLAGEVALLVYHMHGPDEGKRTQWTARAKDMLNIDVTFSEVPVRVKEPYDERFHALYEDLQKRVGLPATVEQLPSNGDVRIRLQLPDTTMELLLSKKRLVSTTTLIFLIWMIGSALALSAIAILFLRGQIRPIGRLARAAEGFGMGIEDPLFRPQGSREVRQAARAFLTMKSRISRQIATRTAMLSGISHDLRTPLTRMKLQLAMLPPSEEVEALNRDIREMEQMISEYLAFARGEDGELSQPVVLAEFLREIVGPHQAVGEPVTLQIISAGVLPLRRQRMRRAIDNLIVNAVRYGKAARVTLEATTRQVFIIVDDDGPGIPEGEQDMVFQPFRRLESSRNAATGGVGLGLTIAREAVQAHGGEIELKNRMADGKITGLRVMVRLPVPLV